MSVESGRGVCKDTAAPVGSAETGDTAMQGGADTSFEISRSENCTSWFADSYYGHKGYYIRLKTKYPDTRVSL